MTTATMTEADTIRLQIEELARKESAVKQKVEKLQQQLDEIRESRQRLKASLLAAVARQLEGIDGCIRISRVQSLGPGMPFVHADHINIPATILKVNRTRALLRFLRPVRGETEWNIPLTEIRVLPDFAEQYEIEPDAMRRATPDEA